MKILASNSWQHVTHSDADEACLGDVYALQIDAKELAELGVVLGRFDASSGCFERCLLTKATLRRLGSLGGKYFWDLLPVKGQVPAASFNSSSAPVVFH